MEWGDRMEDITVEKKIDGIVYKAKYKGISFLLSIEDIENKNKNAILPVARILFNEVLVSPKIGINDFADMAAFSRVYDFLYEVAHGKVSDVKLSKSQLKKRANDNWSCWRLVLSDRGFDFQTVFGKPYMTPQDIREANYALDMQIAAERRQMKKGT